MIELQFMNVMKYTRVHLLPVFVLRTEMDLLHQHLATVAHPKAAILKPSQLVQNAKFAIF